MVRHFFEATWILAMSYNACSLLSYIPFHLVPSLTSNNVVHHLAVGIPNYRLVFVPYLYMFL